MDSIKVSKRDFTLKAKQLRKAGMIPGSIFGGPLSDAVSLQIEKGACKKLLESSHVGSRVEVELDGEKYPAQIKDKSVNPLNNEIQHVNFQALKAGQKVNSVIQIVLLNTDKVTALLEQMITEIPYASLPRHMVDTVSIDVDGLPVGTTVTIGDVKELQSDTLELQLSPDEVIFKIVEKKAMDSEEEASAETAE